MARNLPSPSARAAALAEITLEIARDNALITTESIDEALSCLTEAHDKSGKEHDLRQSAIGIAQLLLQQLVRH